MASDLPAAFSKLVTRVRARGVGEVATLGLARVREQIASAETLVILTRETEGAPPPDSSLSLRALSVDDASAYAGAIGTDSPSTFRARLSDSTTCYAAVDEGRILHTSWVTTGCAWTRELRSFLCPPKGEAYVYESFTRGDARGRGVYPFALAEICRDLRARGVPRLWVAVEAHNEASLRAVAKAGFLRVSEIRYARRLGRLRLELPYDVKSDRPAEGFGKKRHIRLTGDGAIQE